MILVDANILIYAYDTGARLHAAARAWIESAFSGSEPIAIPWAVAHAFLRLTTHGPLMANPYAPAEACAIVNDWFESPAVTFVEPGREYWRLLRQIAVTHDIRGPLYSDAHLAVIALEHDATIYTRDKDFRRFAGVRVVDPLA